MNETTHSVRIWSIEKRVGKRRTTYYTRWKVGTQAFREGFTTYALADAFRAKLVTATRNGIASVVDSLFAPMP